MDQLPRSLPEEIQQWGAPRAIRRARSFLLLIELLAGGLWFLLCLAPTLFAVVITFAGLFKGEMAAFGMGLLLVTFFGTLAFIGGKIMLRAWWGLAIRLIVFPEGIIYTRGRRIVPYRWQDILAFSYWAIDHVKLGTYIDSLYYYRFHHRDGHRFLFAERLDRNADKPIAQFVEEGLVNYQLPLLRESFLQRTEEVRFGPFILGMEGLGYKRDLLPWPEVDFIWAEDGRVRVRKKGKTLNWCSARMDNVPNMCLFLALAKERLAQEESRQ